MLLGTLGASLSGNLLAEKDTIRAGEGIITADQEKLWKYKIWKYKSNIKMNLNLMVFAHKIIYLK